MIIKLMKTVMVFLLGVITGEIIAGWVFAYMEDLKPGFFGEFNREIDELVNLVMN